MRKLFTPLLLIGLCLFSFGYGLMAQVIHHPQPGLSAVRRNYTTFTQYIRDTTTECRNANAGLEGTPEFGQLYKGAPCSNCYELIGKRTARNKTFLTRGHAGKEVLTQTATEDINYLDTAGNWRTIKHWLQPSAPGVYSAPEQPAPVVINAGGSFTALGDEVHQFRFNKDLELVYSRPDGTDSLLGAVNWTDHTAGDDGVYVTDAWPGIDMELHAIRGGIKTNFIIKQAMPQFAAGRLLVRDHPELADSLSLYAEGGDDFAGVLEVRNRAGEQVYVISTATAFEQHDALHTLRPINYHLSSAGTLDIVLPGDFLDRPSNAYPVIIDPLVVLGTSVAVAGSTFSPGWTVGCPTLDPAVVPGDITVTDVWFSFYYEASGGAMQTNGSLDFTTGTCRSPGLTGYYWYCPVYIPGICGGDSISIINDLGACVPPVQCAAYNLNVTMNMYQSYLTDPPCSNLYITANSPLTITTVGQVFDVHATSTDSVICAGSPSTLTATPLFGIPPYTYSWSPGGATSPSITVSPSSTQTYTVTATDACGTVATATTVLTVNPVAPVLGPAVVCVGTSITLTNAAGAGTWISSNPAVASAGISTGIITGVAPGVVTITYTNPYGCVSTFALTVTGQPGPITGDTSICIGSVVTLADVTAGGTWSAAGAIVSIDPASGAITGTIVGTTTVSYSLGTACYATRTVDVLPMPVISGFTFSAPSSCVSADGTITLNGLASGVSYTINYLFNGLPQTVVVTANAAGNAVIFGLAGGMYVNFTATNAAGCTSVVMAGPVNLPLPPTPPAPVASNSGPVCAGGSITLSATSGSAGASFNWSGPLGFSSSLPGPVIVSAPAAASGTYSVTVTVLGCVSAPATTTVVINPVPAISSATGTDPSTCQGSDGFILLAGLIPGLSYLVSYTSGGAVFSASLVADAGGNITIPGLSAGSYTGITVSSFGCLSMAAGPVTLVNPGAPPVPQASANSPLCAGAILDLYASDAMTGVTYSWAGPAGFSSALQNPVIYNVTAAVAGVYTVTAATATCFASATTMVSLYPAVSLSAVTSSQVLPLGSSVHLYASGAQYYIWAPDDGSLNDPNIPDPRATPTVTTVYTVTGTNIYGCMDTATLTLTVSDTGSVLIPNAFTPNNDGRNDVFRIVNPRHYKLVDFSVFNRWGQLVYHNGSNISQGWDGSFNGQPAEIGTYNYVIILAATDGTETTFSGTVTLIR